MGSFPGESPGTTSWVLVLTVKVLPLKLETLKIFISRCSSPTPFTSPSPPSLPLLSSLRALSIPRVVTVV
ncbi:hypothetical protein L6452_15022 [Arctium lappa]|uniref:Uncharacterized protein n=1 Tax=Arctium lappa TaxID=4217 RepID=A0ACB9CMQ6_ARCLA|nr:hypothetical protein L6452_15022 [Arctium lappa]